MRRRTLLTTATSATVGLVLSACGVQQQALWQVPVNSGSQGRSGDVSVQNARFAARAPAPDGQLYRPGETVPLEATIVNRGVVADRLMSISSPTARGGQLAGASTLAPEGALTLGPGPRDSDAQLTALTVPIRPGLTYPVVLTFARSGEVRLDVRAEAAQPHRPDCPLPPNGQTPDTFTAPDGAPVPPAPSDPRCSTLP